MNLLQQIYDDADMAEDLTILIGSFGHLEHLWPCLKSIFDTVTGGTSFRVIVGFNFRGESDSPRAGVAAISLLIFAAASPPDRPRYIAERV